MIRRFPLVRVGLVLLVAALGAAACTSIGQDELADRYRGDVATPDNTLPTPETTDDGTDEASAVPQGPTSTDGRPPRAEPLAVTWDDCVFDPAGLDVECGSIEIPSTGGSLDPIRVAFARFRAETPSQADPVIYLHGGPGGAVLSAADRLYGPVVSPFIAERDVIIYDQRGAGESSPLPICTEAWDLDDAFFTTATPHVELRDDYTASLVDCAERLQRRDDIDLSDYSSAVHADDLLDLIRALDYDRVNLYGVSYGTRLAQTMLRDHPAPIRSSILSGVYPAEENLIGSTPAAFEQGMRQVFAACEADATCADLLPDPVASLEARVAALDADPLIVEIPVNEGESYPFALAGDDFLNILHGLLYAVDGAALIPDLLIDLDAGDTDRLQRLGNDGIFDTADVAAFLGVQCREEVPFTTDDELATASRLETMWDRINLPPGLLSDDMLDICAGWSSIGSAEPLENRAITWTQPTLVMSGAFDPITPPEWGVAMAARLPDAALALSPDRGHDADEGACAVEIMQAFIAAPSASVDVGCTGDNPLPYITATNVEVYERNSISLTESIVDIDPGPDTEWADMLLPDWVADFYDDEEVYWRNVDIYDPTVIVVRSGPFDGDELIWYLPFEVIRNDFEQTDVPAEVDAGWTRWVYETVGMDIVTYIREGTPDLNVSVVAADRDIDELERSVVSMVNSFDGP